MKLPMASGLEDDELGVEVDDGVVVLWWQLPVVVSPSLSIGLGLGRWGTVAAANLFSRSSNPTSTL